MHAWEPTQPDRTSIESFIFSFCREYKAWNDDAQAMQSREGAEAKNDSVIASYARLICSFVVPETQPQLPAFGSEASFDADRLDLGSITLTADGAVAEFAIRSTFGSWSSNFVADLTLQPIMAIRQIFYISPYPEWGSDRLPFL